MHNSLSSVGLLALGLLLSTTVSGQGLSFRDLPNPGSYEAGSDAYGTPDASQGFYPQDAAGQSTWGSSGAFESQWSTGQTGAWQLNPRQWAGERWGQGQEDWDASQWDQPRGPQAPIMNSPGSGSFGFAPGQGAEPRYTPEMGFRPDPRFQSAPSSPSSGTPSFRFRGDPDQSAAFSSGGFHFRPLTRGDQLRRSRGEISGFRPLEPNPSGPVGRPTPSYYDEWPN